MQRSTKDQEIPSDGNFLDEPIRRNKNPRRTDKTCSPGISDRFWFFPLVGQGVSLNPEPFAFGYKESPQTSRLRGFSGASDVTRTRDLLITKGIKKRKASISNRFAPFFLENKFRLNLFAPYPPPAPFPVWVRVWVRPDS